MAANQIDLQRQRYEDLTAAELVGMVEGIRLTGNGQLHEALHIMTASLDLEHFISVIPLDPSQMTSEEVSEILELRDRLFKLSGTFVRLNVLFELRSQGITARESDRIVTKAPEPSPKSEF